MSKFICFSNQVWDLGGQERLRTSWATYYRGTHAVIAVIDSTDRARISIMKDELFRLLGHEDLQNSVILVFANKQDLKDAMTPAEITDALSLHSIKNHDWHIQACCALTGEGLYDGLGWIAQRVSGKVPSWRENGLKGKEKKVHFSDIDGFERFLKSVIVYYQTVLNTHYHCCRLFRTFEFPRRIRHVLHNEGFHYKFGNLEMLPYNYYFLHNEAPCQTYVKALLKNVALCNLKTLPTINNQQSEL